CLLELCRDLRIFSGNDLSCVFDYRDLAAKTDEHLPELESDVAAPENNQVTRKRRQVKDGLVRQVVHALQAGDSRDARPCTGVDEDSRAFEHFSFDAELSGTHEAGLSTVEMHLGTACDPLLVPIAPAIDQRILLSDDLWQVGADIVGDDAPARSVSGIVRNLRTMNHRLRGRASRVDARAAELALFDQSNGPSVVSQTIGERNSSLPRPDDDCVVSHGSLAAFVLKVWVRGEHVRAIRIPIR